MSKKISRRDLGRHASAAAIASSAALSTPQHAEAQGRPIPNSYQFPSDFLWGCATAAYQVEGGAKDDDRGPSIWDTFSHIPGKVHNNDNGDVADDSYHRYKEDVGLLKWLGAKIYRFSTSWSRIFPEGSGKANPKGIDFYSRLVDELLANGITPFCTLFHWDLPQALQDRYQGWQSPETSKAFGDFAGYVAEKLSDRVKYFFTMNEFSSFVDLGHKSGIHAPGLKLAPGPLNQIRYHAVLAHGYAVQALRAKAKQAVKIGVAENLQSAIPAIAVEPHIQASAKATRLLNASYLTVIMEGHYPEEFLQEQGADAPAFHGRGLEDHWQST